MKKILSFFAAMLVAVAANAAVVLPATLDVSNVSFRSEGMPDFVLAEGDYAGTYFDMGAHDSANDTLLYAEWDVTIEPIKYDIDVVVYNTNSWRVQLYLLNQDGDTVKDLRYKGSSGQCGKFAIGSMDLKDLEAGNYKLRARAATAWSAMKLKELIVKADYKGATVAMPGTLLPAYAELSANASVTDAGAISFKPSTAPDEYATWNVNFAKAGSFNVSIDFTASNGHTYGVTLLSADGQTEIGGVAEVQSWDTGVKELGAITVPAAGKYIVKLTNITQWSEAVLNSITFAAPAPEHVYSVAGAEALMGSHWNEKEGNELELQDDGKYKLVREGVSLAVGSYEYKVVIDHKWNNGEAANNSVLSIDKAGKYDVTFTYDAAIPETSATAELKEEQIIIPTVKLAGIDGWGGEEMTLAEDKKTCSIKKSLDAGSYEFKVIVGGNWLGASQEFTRENNSYVVATNDQNMKLAADVAGEYTFTWTFETNALEITFPAAAPVVDEWVEIKFAEAAAADDIAEDASYTVPGTEFALVLHDAGNKMSIDANDCRFGTVEDYTMYNYRIKSGGASSSTKNYFTLNIPEAGTLRIAPRTSSPSATDRALVIAQGDKELYNAIVQESQATEVQEGVKVYPYVEVKVAKGEVRVSYTAGMNFYAFAFKAEKSDPTAISNAEALTPVKKMIENGQLVIIRNGVKFNVQGQVIR